MFKNPWIGSLTYCLKFKRVGFIPFYECFINPFFWDFIALGEYLEKERSSFPRFYFVGDEDLLEIIGNSKDLHRVQKHFKKMFAGISSVELVDESIITSLVSKEGESVRLKSPISVKEYPRINDWLDALEKEMKRSLSHLLSESVLNLSQFYFDSSWTSNQFLSWMDLFPAQVVVLSIQVIWFVVVSFYEH
jgi:dynein heavy chain 1, cytosolic